MKLYGSITSPYVRRLRILLAGQDYEFEAVNIFGQERSKLKEVNPTLKIPMFEDKSDASVPLLLDSNIIYEYIADKLSIPALTWHQKNDLALINSCNDSLVNMMILTRSKVDVNEDKLYFNIQRERCITTFDYFEKKLEANQFDWDYIAISFLVLVEWAQFRGLFDFNNYPAILNFIAHCQNQPGVRETKPQD